MMCGASPGFCALKSPAACMQPACRPTTSSTNTLVDGRAREATSSAASRVDTAMYLAAEPKPGQQSVTGKSLSTVLGIPLQVQGTAVWTAISDTFCAVSMESLPPL